MADMEYESLTSEEDDEESELPMPNQEIILQKFKQVLACKNADECKQHVLWIETTPLPPKTQRQILDMLMNNEIPNAGHKMISSKLLRLNPMIRYELNAHFLKFLAQPSISFEQVRNVLNICEPRQDHEKTEAQNLIQKLIPRAEMLELLLAYCAEHKLILDLTQVSCEQMATCTGSLCDYLAHVLDDKLEVKYRALITNTLREAVISDKHVRDALKVINFLLELATNFFPAYEQYVILYYLMFKLHFLVNRFAKKRPAR